MISFNVLKYFDYPQFGKRCCKQCVKILKFQEERYNLNKISILRRPGGGARMLRQRIETPVRRSLRDVSVQSKGKLLLSKLKGASQKSKYFLGLIAPAKWDCSSFRCSWHRFKERDLLYYPFPLYFFLHKRNWWVWSRGTLLTLFLAFQRQKIPTVISILPPKTQIYLSLESLTSYTLVLKSKYFLED